MVGPDPGVSVDIKCINYFRFTLGQDDTHVQEEIEEDMNFGRQEKHRETRRVEERGERDRMVMMGPKYLKQEDGKAKHGTRDRWSATEAHYATDIRIRENSILKWSRGQLTKNKLNNRTRGLLLVNRPEKLTGKSQERGKGSEKNG